jgi:hypothetical protein
MAFLYAPIRIVGGVALILIGILGLILPVMPGWPFILVGLALLSRHFHWARRLRRQVRRFRLNMQRRWNGGKRQRDPVQPEAMAPTPAPKSSLKRDPATSSPASNLHP